MRHNKKWQVMVLLVCIVLITVGCHQKQKTPNKPAQTLTDVQTNGTHKGDLYNSVFECYSDITELGVIINNPTEEDLNKVKNLDTYGKSQETSMLIIPKYNGSKITVSKAEYTGEQYIAKEVLFSTDATPMDYGLHLYANRPEGIPELIVTINYEKVNCRYIISSNGKDGHSGIEFLKVENTDKKQGEGELVPPIVDATYVQGLNLFSSSEVDVDGDGKNEILEVYCDGTINSNGEYSLDDRQTWAMILKKGDAFYPLFDKAYIQLGNLQYTIYEDYDDYDKVHIIMEYKTGTALYYYDCTYDDESGNIQRKSFFEADNINLIRSW